MRAQAIGQRQGDTAAAFSLTWTAVVSFLLLLTSDTPDPGFLFPVAAAALPFAAAPRHRVLFRVGAALLLLGFVALRGLEMRGILFLPAMAALFLSAHRVRRQSAGPVRRRQRR